MALNNHWYELHDRKTGEFLDGPFNDLEYAECERQDWYRTYPKITIDIVVRYPKAVLASISKSRARKRQQRRQSYA